MKIYIIIVNIWIEINYFCSYEANKATAKNSEASAGTRVGAAIDAVGDKVDETKHSARKEEHKQRAIH